MKNIKRSLITLAIAAALCLPFVGCKGTFQNTAIKYGVSEAVQYGVKEYPDAKPYLQAVTPVICSAANGTNLSPNAVMDALEASTAANAVKTKGGVIVANIVISLYSGVWESYGAGAVETNAALKGVLTAVCDGMTDALSVRTRAMKRYLQ